MNGMGGQIEPPGPSSIQASIILLYLYLRLSVFICGLISFAPHASQKIAL